MSDINDQVIKAIQAYADTLPNADFKLNLLSAAEDMAPKLIESLALKQEWAVLRMESYTRFDRRGDRLPVMEEIDGVVGAETDDYQVAHQELEWQRKYNYRNAESSTRLCIGGRLFTDWAEDIQPQVDPELEAALNLPGT